MASISDNYEINVALKENVDDKYGRHWCRIELPDSFESTAENKLEFIREIFGDRFHVSMRKWECRGRAKEEWE